ILTLAVSPDGRLAAAGTSNGVRLFDTVAGVELGGAVGHKGTVRALAFSRDGSRLASGSDDAMVIVWDVAKLARDRLPPRLGADANATQMNTWWNDLGSNDGARANIAVWRLTEAPVEKVVALVRERLKPTSRPSADEIAKWIS